MPKFKINFVTYIPKSESTVANLKIPYAINLEPLQSTCIEYSNNLIPW